MVLKSPHVGPKFSSLLWADQIPLTWRTWTCRSSMRPSVSGLRPRKRECPDHLRVLFLLVMSSALPQPVPRPRVCQWRRLRAINGCALSTGAIRTSPKPPPLPSPPLGRAERGCGSTTTSPRPTTCWPRGSGGASTARSQGRVRLSEGPPRGRDLRLKTWRLFCMPCLHSPAIGSTGLTYVRAKVCEAERSFQRAADHEARVQDAPQAWGRSAPKAQSVFTSSRGVPRRIVKIV